MKDMRIEDSLTYSKDRNFRGWIDTDHFADDPRNWDNFGTMVCFHGKYSLGDKHNFREDDYNSWDEIKDAIKEAGGVLILPLGIYDHGNISIYVGTKVDKWDSGQVGFIYCTNADLEREGIDIEKAEELLRSEVKSYDAYLRGEIYVWGVEQWTKACSCGECKAWESVETNGGYIKYADAVRDMKECLENFEVEVNA